MGKDIPSKLKQTESWGSNTYIKEDKSLKCNKNSAPT